MKTQRLLFTVCLLICFAALGGAAYLQYSVGLKPCSMCIIQRWAIIGLTLWLILAICHRPQPRGQIVYGFGIIILAALGGITAARQVWLQHLPPAEQPACGPGFDYLIENFPLTEALGYIFAGDGNCATIDWTFLGQSLAVWSLCTFIVFAIAGSWVALRAIRHK